MKFPRLTNLLVQFSSSFLFISRTLWLLWTTFTFFSRLLARRSVSTDYARGALNSTFDFYLLCVYFLYVSRTIESILLGCVFKTSGCVVSLSLILTLSSMKLGCCFLCFSLLSILNCFIDLFIITFFNWWWAILSVYI